MKALAESLIGDFVMGVCRMTRTWVNIFKLGLVVFTFRLAQISCVLTMRLKHMIRRYAHYSPSSEANMVWHKRT